MDAYDAALTGKRRTDVAKRWLRAARRYATLLNPLSEITEIALEIEPEGEALDAALADMHELEDRVRKARQ